jgi:asparagine synthase (glutamine-hydrolysing)
MCGIAGIYSFKEKLNLDGIKRMTDSLRHRGPDDEGFLAVNSVTREVYPLIGRGSGVEGNRIESFDKPADLFLGHRRLSIIDLSAAGHQPMCNEEGSIWVVYNGEIYNYLEVRRELELLGHLFKSKTDTEVILQAYEEWGTDCLNRFNGMWSFCIWDSGKRQIFCSRDRMGVKPFYYTFNGKRFAFASEIKALLALDDMTPEPNDQIVADYLFSGLQDHTSETFFKDIYQLRPAEYLLLNGQRLILQSYWDIEPKEIHFPEDEDYTQRFRELFEDSIRLRLRSDVPMGSCLSGGLDSSTIVCLANRLMFDGEMIDPKLVGKQQKTFSSCFESPGCDERPFIEIVLEQTGAERNYVFPKGERLLQDLSTLVWYQDEPFGSTSIYAQWEVMRLAKERGVTVLLDGQGGDELLGGYLPSFYYLFYDLLRGLKWRYLIKEIWGFGNNHTAWIASRFRNRMGKKIDWAEEAFRRRFLRSFPVPLKCENKLNNYLYHCLRFTTLPRLLHYEDRNSMAFSIEARLPFLDFRLVEYIFSLPAEQKVRGGVTKILLRDTMKGILPEPIRNRHDKMGFATPEDIWFRAALRETINRIITSKSFRQRGYFAADRVKGIFEDYCKGERNINSAIWNWVNLELWLRRFIDGNPLPLD